MTDRARPSRLWIGCAAIVGAAVALPVGIYIGSSGGESQRSPAGASPGSSGSRNVYSPSVLSDPHVIDQQRRVVEALELSCRQSNAYCEEARQARLRIMEAEASR
jgi:hypothetical protein